MSDQNDSSKPQPMAFTINFSDGKDVSSPKPVSDNLSRYTRHIRNSSLPNVDEKKKIITKNGASSVQAMCMSPLMLRKGLVSQRPGYHSEGYFSSDQEDDLKAKGSVFVRKLKNLEKGVRTTNLAQEKKIMADQNTQRKLKHSVDDEQQKFGKFRENFNGQHDPECSVEYDLVHQAVGSSVTFTDIRDSEEWLGAGASDEELENPCDNALAVEGGGGDVDEILNDSSNDTVSEAGTYTIERDTPCPEVMRARQDLENVILKIGQMRTYTEEGAGCADDEESGFKRSLYTDGSHWINEWATQVAKHNHDTGFEKSAITGLPIIPVGKQQGPTPVSTSKIASPVHERTVPSSGRKHTPSPHRTRTRNIDSPFNNLILHEPLVCDVTNSERHSDSSLETESFLRTTESVVSAMQARMSLSVDSGGESDVDTSHSYQGPERGLNTTPCSGDHFGSTRRPSNASDSSIRHESRATQSDSSSEAGDTKNKKKENVAASTPQMRYNRAFSLRRARLDCEPEPPVDRKKKLSVTEAPPVVTNKPKKLHESTKPNPTRPTKTKTIKTESFSRTDSGRFSMRGSKPPAPPQPSLPPKPGNAKKDSKKAPGARSNSTLSSREVEFQNWKRRKSYDPMKAAAEGKKKEAAKKASMSTSMTQSSILDSESSPSHQNPVLRSASFHGTGGMTPNYVSSEEEVTLSADEDSPISGCLPSLVATTSPPTKLNDCEFQAVIEGAFGGSRVSLHSTTSNPSVRGRVKMEALDSLVMAAVCGLSNKLCSHSCKLLKKLRYLYEEDVERSEKLSDVIDLLETIAPLGSPQTKSPSKELSGTLKNLKRIETVFKVLDDILFDEEEFEVDMDSYH